MPEAAFAPAPPVDDWRAGGFGVYVHWPFCAAKCPYCDFNSHVRAGIDAERWGRALAEEITRTARLVPGRRVDSIFFGGGTPSLMPPETTATIVEAIRAAWNVAPEAEVTLEANPTSVEAGRFRGYRDAGVNRLSLGVQALDDRDLRTLGRLHDATEARRAFELAQAIFPRTSFDLIYARQGQTVAEWKAELQEALAMASDHLSLYQLTIEPGTRFGDLAARRRLRGLPSEDVAASMYLATQEICAAAGMPAYEISNHARPGAEGRHNLVYWRYGDYAGIGPGAHGRLTVNGSRLAIEEKRAPEQWLATTEAASSRTVAGTEITGQEQAIEMTMMGLRLAEGIPLDRYAALAGNPLDPNAIGELAGLGLISAPQQGYIAATVRGRAVLDAILRRLLT